MLDVLDVMIVGGGPVGLFLGCRLAQLGFAVRVLEPRAEPRAHSRAIGVHPPALERLAELGLADAFVREGVRVTRGHAYAGTKRLGTLSFGDLPGPYPFVLTLPQPRTETLLKGRLRELAPDALLRAEVRGLEQTAAHVQVTLATGERLTARFLVAADGKTSFVRNALNIPFRGRSYPDHYLMGDFHDTADPRAGPRAGLSADFGTDAALYFTRAGLVESFPLPGGLRRWVAKTPERAQEAEPSLLVRLVRERLNINLPVETNTMLSAFGIQKFLADRFVTGRVALVGDAAHVVSPIGGQGMNLGWLGAWRLAESLATTGSLSGYAAHRRSARRAVLRAEFNTVMGRATPVAGARDAAVWSILHSPLRGPFARMFTMRGL